jgi:hypothetical protein
LTPFELKQPDSVFVSAGRKAYMLGVYSQDCPYRLSYHNRLWNIGYMAAKRTLEVKRPFRKAGDVKRS